MKVAIISDTHFGARNDSQQFNASFERFYKEVFFPYLEKTQIKTVLHLGDVFDRRKYINFQILKSCKEYFFEPLREMGCEMYVIPGNHDTYYKNTNEVNSIDLLLKEYDNITVFHEPTKWKFGTRPVAFVPWICNENQDKCLSFLKGEFDEKTLCFGHFEIAGFDMFRGIKNDSGMDRQVLNAFPMVMTGHYHHRSAEGNIFYLGSPYEFTWSDYNDPRGFHILDTDTTELEFIENPFTMFKKLYYDDRKVMEFDARDYSKKCVKVIVAHKSDFPKFEWMIESLYTNEVMELTIHEDFSDFESTGMDDEITAVEDTMSLLSDFVDSTETVEDKDKLKTLLKSLYVEAQHMEK